LLLREDQDVFEKPDTPGGRPPAQRDAERTRLAILEAATAAFVARGLDAASVNEIAARAGVNKRMLYHYFGNKEALYVAVLERTYSGIRRAEVELKLGDLAPEAAMRRLVLFTWTYFVEHPAFLSLLNTENLHFGRHLRRSTLIQDLHSPLRGLLSDVLERGAKLGVFRPRVDPVQLYISIAALGFFYLSNRHTLSTIFNRDLETPENLEARGEHIVDMVLRFLRP